MASFWQKAANVTKQVGKIGLAVVGMGLTAVTGILLTGLGAAWDMGPIVVCVALALTVFVLGGVCEAAGIKDAFEGGIKIAGDLLQTAGAIAVATMSYSSSSSRSSYSLAGRAAKETKELLSQQKDVISDAIAKIKKGPETATQSPKDFQQSSDRSLRGGLGHR